MHHVKPAVEAYGKKENDANGGEREVKKVELGAPIVLSAPDQLFKSGLSPDCHQTVIPIVTKLSSNCDPDCHQIVTKLSGKSDPDCHQIVSKQ